MSSFPNQTARPGVNAKLELCHFRQVGSDPPGLLLGRSLSPFGWSAK